MTPVYQFLGNHLQCVLGDFDRFLVVEKVACDVVQKREYFPFFFLFGLAFLPFILLLLRSCLYYVAGLGQDCMKKQRVGEEE